MTTPGRFTARGGAEVEARVSAAVRDAAEAARAALPAREVRVLALMGGYGRGEGGVEVVAGTERPHNNLDFLLVTTGRGVLHTESLRRRLSDALQPVAAAHGIGMDAGAVSDLALRTAPCRVMWYDARFGHRTLLGDPAFLPGLSRFTAESLLPSDVRDLVVNRGTLLVIDDAVADLPAPPAGIGKALVRHAVKAVIGFGDGLLFARGAYHWSYVERQRRMAARDDVPAAFRGLYDRAMEFRFRPDYAAFGAPDAPRAFVDEVRAACEPVHRAFESARLGVPDLPWTRYPDAALRRSARDGLDHPREAARRAKALLQSARDDLRGLRGGPGGGLPIDAPADVAAAWRLTPPRDRLALVFPVVAWRLPDARFRALAAAFLQAPDDDAALRLAFLRAWGVHGDPNFGEAARRLGLDLGGAP